MIACSPHRFVWAFFLVFAILESSHAQQTANGDNIPDGGHYLRPANSKAMEDSILNLPLDWSTPAIADNDQKRKLRPKGTKSNKRAKKQSSRSRRNRRRKGGPYMGRVTPVPSSTPEPFRFGTFQCTNDADCVGTDVEYECSNRECVVQNCTIQLAAGKVACCVNSDCTEDNTICVTNFCIQTGTLAFTLTWFGDDDLDLHVITPGGYEIFFADPFDATSGGQLDFDDIPRNQGGIGLYVENIYFPETAPTGLYRYFVRDFTQIETGDAYKLEARVDGVVMPGSIQTGKFTDDSDSDSAISSYEKR